MRLYRNYIQSGWFVRPQHLDLAPVVCANMQAAYGTKEGKFDASYFRSIKATR